VSVTISHAIVTMANCAPALTKEPASAENVSAPLDGLENHVNAKHLPTLAFPLAVAKFALAKAHVSVESASALKTPNKADTLADIARSAP
jgi:hypothetical protein